MVPTTGPRSAAVAAPQDSAGASAPALCEVRIAFSSVHSGLSGGQVEEGLYADLAENHRLVSFQPPSPQQLLNRYNVALAQAMLYRCREIEVTIGPDPCRSCRIRTHDSASARCPSPRRA